MTGWSLIRLALARTREYPEGSPGHAYELIVPLGADNRIDRAAFSAFPGRASVQRLLPGERVSRGAVIARDGGFAFSYAPGDADDEAIFHLENHPLGVGDYVTVIEPDGDIRPYRVESVLSLPAPTA